MSLIYPIAKQGMESAQIDVMGRPVRCALCNASYTFNASHQFRVSLAGVLALSPVLTGKSNTSGIFRADDTVFSAVTGGSIIAYIAGYIDTGDPTTDPLIWLNDGLSGVTNDQDITVHWDATGPYGIFAI